MLWLLIYVRWKDDKKIVRLTSTDYPMYWRFISASGLNVSQKKEDSDIDSLRSFNTAVWHTKQVNHYVILIVKSDELFQPNGKVREKRVREWVREKERTGKKVAELNAKDPVSLWGIAIIQSILSRPYITIHLQVRTIN